MIGQKLAHYEILEQIGLGGMGEVYRARDRRLEREVAIKTLPEAFSKDPERLARFEREAKILASLSHPNIGTIFGLENVEGRRFLVLELIEGETLAERLGRGPFPVREALELALQIAEALEAAHEEGVIHRDLKPANIKITPSGQVKVLDFGLAKELRPEVAQVDVSQSPTLTQPMTQAGFLLGTAAYMSPEQARGNPADRQADVWAFGCVLYEMLSGQQTFRGDTVTDLLAVVLEREPDWKNLPDATPALARSVLRRCLEKDTRRRLHDIADARIELEEALQEPIPAAEPLSITARKAEFRRGILWGLAGVGLAAGLALLTWLWIRPGPIPAPIRRFQLAPPSKVLVSESFQATLALSPDGRWVAFQGQRADDPTDPPRLYLRSVEELEARAVPGTERAYNPFFSPDSRWLGFAADNVLKRVSVEGGEPLPICGSQRLRGASWGEDGTILFASGSKGLFRVAAAGGEPEAVTAPDPDHGEASHYWPQLLPGARAALFVVRTGSRESRQRIAVLSLQTGRYRTLVTGGTYPRYSRTGHLIYSRLGTLHAAPFDLERLELTGGFQRVLQDVYYDYYTGFVAYALSEAGSLTYAPGAPRVSDHELVWIDRKGKIEPAVEDQRPFLGKPAFSPDYRQFAIEIESGVGESDIWIYEMVRENWTRLTFKGGNSPLWSPDGRWIVFASDRTGPFKVYRVAADGSGALEQLTSGHETWDFPESYSPDGEVLTFRRQMGPAQFDILTMATESDRTPRSFVSTPKWETRSVFSPDGRWVAYLSDESGQSEVYLRPFPGPGAKVKVSAGGGWDPDWNPNGGEILYRGLDQTIWAVPIETEPELSVGRPQLLFEVEFLSGPFASAFAVARDGRRLLLVRFPEENHAPRQLVYVPDWDEELKRSLLD